MAERPDWLAAVEAVLSADTGNLRALAEIAGADPATLYLGTRMDGANLCGQDLRGMKFSHLNPAKVQWDEKTELDATTRAMLSTNPQTRKRAHRPAEIGKSEIRIFVSYSHADEAARAKLEVHLAPLKRENVVTWYDQEIRAGDSLDQSIARELRQSHLFVALLSPDYLASNYCWELEFKRAMSRRARGAAHVVAVIVRPCDWKNTRAARFKLLPKDGRPVSNWKSADEAFLDVAIGIRKVVKSIRGELSETSSKSRRKVKPTSSPKAAKPRSAAKLKGEASAKPASKPKRSAAVIQPRQASSRLPRRTKTE